MTRQEIQELVEELEKKSENKGKLDDYELCILDVAHGLKKEGKELSERTIEEIKFWMK